MSGTSGGPATDTVPGVADAEVAVAGCNMAVGPVGSSHLPLADHTEAASVRRAKQSRYMSQEVESYETKQGYSPTLTSRSGVLTHKPGSILPIFLLSS